MEWFQRDVEGDPGPDLVSIRYCYTSCKLKAELSATQKKPCPEQWKPGLLENSGWVGGRNGKHGATFETVV